MAKLYFRYGTVGSAKTLNLLAVAHNYKIQGKHVFLIKPRCEQRFHPENIRSRAGLEKKADLLVDDDTQLPVKEFAGLSCILVDEAQFMSPFVIKQLREIARQLHIPVICYGLRSDFRGDLFDGAKALFELADSIEEVKTTCAFCDRKAIMNLKHLEGVPTVLGPSVDLGAEEKYLPACYGCYVEQLEQAHALRSTPKRDCGTNAPTDS